jgi:exoribonuclease II
MNRTRPHRRSDLVRIATEAMVGRGLEPEFPARALQQVATLAGPGRDTGPLVRDLTALPWCSIDNDDSLDLDQLTACEPLAGGAVKVTVAVADVDALVKKGSPIDEHARTNTTSVYTSARIFPMLPERLSTDLTSLNAGQDRLALVTTMTIDAQGAIAHSAVERALVHNRAKLAYDAVSAWIDGTGALPAAAAAVPGMDLQLKTQDAVAQRLRARRHAQGSLELQTFQPRAVFDGERVVDIRQQVQNRARQLIEEFMIATNGCTARFLAAGGGASLRRVVRSPERWLRIVEVARNLGEVLPQQPDSKALEAFLAKRRLADPLRFPDLSLVIIKLMGSGEYVVEQAGAEPIGHFGLAARDYTHSTAPNRRYPDLITLRMLKALLAGAPPAYSTGDLHALADHCTQQEDAAQKVERRMRKSEAALLLESRVGQQFDAIVTGVSATDTWVRIFQPPAEGKLMVERAQLEVGRQLRVKLVSTDVERGFIDFVWVD